jgi:hypothetical protein
MDSLTACAWRSDSSQLTRPTAAYTSKSHVIAARLVGHDRNFAFNRQVGSLCTPDGLAVSAT